MKKFTNKKVMMFLGVAVLIVATQIAVTRYEESRPSKPTTSITK